MFTGGDGFTALGNGHAIKTEHDAKIIMNMIIDYVRDKKLIAPQLEGRVVQLSS